MGSRVAGANDGTEKLKHKKMLVWDLSIPFVKYVNHDFSVREEHKIYEPKRKSEI